MTNQKTNSNTNWATIELDYTHPHGLKGQAAIEWVSQHIKHAEPSFLVEHVGIGGGGLPALLVSGERQVLRKWYVEVYNPEDESNWSSQDFEEWAHPYKGNNQ